MVRWTIGDVSDAGFETLRCSIWGAHRLFGEQARYVVCLNSVPLYDGRARAGDLPADVEWRVVTRNDIPSFIRSHLDSALAEGVGWKFAPLQLATDRPELALDNDRILWELPGALRRWQRGDRTPVMAEDVRLLRCSPFPPHLPHPGRCGVHFVGVSARSLLWSYDGRPATDYIQAHWRRWRDDVMNGHCSER